MVVGVLLLPPMRSTGVISIICTSSAVISREILSKALLWNRAQVRNCVPPLISILGATLFHRQEANSHVLLSVVY